MRFGKNKYDLATIAFTIASYAQIGTSLYYYSQGEIAEGIAAGLTGAVFFEIGNTLVPDQKTSDGVDVKEKPTTRKLLRPLRIGMMGVAATSLAITAHYDASVFFNPATTLAYTGVASGLYFLGTDPVSPQKDPFYKRALHWLKERLPSAESATVHSVGASDVS